MAQVYNKYLKSDGEEPLMVENSSIQQIEEKNNYDMNKENDPFGDLLNF